MLFFKQTKCMFVEHLCPRPCPLDFCRSLERDPFLGTAKAVDLIYAQVKMTFHRDTLILFPIGGSVLHGVSIVMTKGRAAGGRGVGQA